MKNSLQTRVSSSSTRNHFDAAAAFYNDIAVVQKQVAQRLAASLDPWKDTLPKGPAIELGCGTGFLTKELCRLFKQRELIASDVSQAMLDVCQKNVSEAENVSYQLQDARDIPVEKPIFALTISNFVAQWFSNPAYTLAQWLEVTRPEGLLLAAFPGHESFPEWKNCAQALGIPFTGNTLPDTEEMVIKLSSDQTQVDYYEDTITQQFQSAVDFFRHIKNIGAGKQLDGRHLSAKEMHMLINHWDEQETGDITVSWHVVFLAVKKIS